MTLTDDSALKMRKVDLLVEKMKAFSKNVFILFVQTVNKEGEHLSDQATRIRVLSMSRMTLTFTSEFLDTRLSC